MDRKALVLYLENVRDMEVVIKRINDLRERERYSFNNRVRQLPTTAKRSEYDKNASISSMLFGIVAGIAMLLPLIFVISMFIYDKVLNRPIYGSMIPILVFICLAIAIFATIPGIGLIIGSFTSYSSAKKYNLHVDEQYEKDLAVANRNKPIVAAYTKEHKERDSFYQAQYERARSILTNLYNMNIIPKPYRDNSINKDRSLATAYYLYDYMSSGQESFQMALISNQMEDGIRRIEAKLDVIIEQLDTVIWQQRVMREENKLNIKHQIDQNNRMIDSLKRMESSQQNIEEYSRLSANYNEAQAFISMAYYLKH